MPARFAASMPTKESSKATEDCGFAPSGTNPIPLDEPYAKLKALAAAATLLRREMGK